MKKKITDLIESLRELESALEHGGDPQNCDIKISKGDWGGEHVLVSMSPWSAAHIARQLVQLIERDFSGAHFHVDKASIAVDTKNQVCFALTKANEGCDSRHLT